MPKFDKELLKKLVEQGKIRQATIDAIPGYADGGVVEEPSIFSKIKSGLGLPQSSEEVIQSLPPERKLLAEDPMLAQSTLPDSSIADKAMAGLEGIAQGARDRQTAKLQSMGVAGADTLAETDPLIEGVAPAESQSFAPQQAFQMPVDSSIGLMEKGLMANMQANAEETKATVDGLQKTQEILAQQQEIETKLNMERQLKLDEQQTKMDLAAQEYMQGKINPDRIWANKSTSQKIGMAAALFFSGINGSQAGAQILNNAIDRDLEAQKADLAGLKNNFEMNRTILSDMMERFGDERQAMAAAKLTQIQMAELQVKGQLARAQGTRGYAEGLQGLAKLQEMKVAAAQKFQMAALLNPETQRQMDFSRAYMSLPKDYQDKAVKLPGNRLGIAVNDQAAKDLTTAIPAYDTLDKIYEKLEAGGSAVAGLAKRGELESLKQQALMQSRGIDKTGALDKGVQEVFDNMIGSPTSINQAGFKAKIKSVREGLRQRKDAELGAKLVNYKPLTLTRVK